jgi:hypothetical protein
MCDVAGMYCRLVEEVEINWCCNGAGESMSIAGERWLLLLNSDSNEICHILMYY